jgi:hypothetical protein
MASSIARTARKCRSTPTPCSSSMGWPELHEHISDAGHGAELVQPVHGDQRPVRRRCQRQSELSTALNPMIPVDHVRTATEAAFRGVVEKPQVRVTSPQRCP